MMSVRRPPLRLGFASTPLPLKGARKGSTAKLGTCPLHLQGERCRAELGGEGAVQTMLHFAAILIAALVLGFFLLASASSEASAHAALVASDPADGAVLAKAPAELSLTFDEPVSPLILKLVEPGGSEAALGKPRFDGNRLVLAAPHDLEQGSYVLSWRVISEDGHPVGGAVVFSIGMPSGSEVV